MIQLRIQQRGLLFEFGSRRNQCVSRYLVGLESRYQPPAVRPITKLFCEVHSSLVHGDDAQPGSQLAFSAKGATLAEGVSAANSLPTVSAS